MKALNEDFLMVVFKLLLNRLNVFAIFMFDLDRETWQWKGSLRRIRTKPRRTIPGFSSDATQAMKGKHHKYSLQFSIHQMLTGDFEELTEIRRKSRGISPVLAACPILDTLITWIPAAEKPLYGNGVV